MASLRLFAASAMLSAAVGVLYLGTVLYESKGAGQNTGRPQRPTVLPPVFRLGSGARVSEPWPPASANTSSSFVLTKSAKVKVQHVEGRMLRSGSRKAEASSIGKNGTVW